MIGISNYVRNMLNRFLVLRKKIRTWTLFINGQPVHVWCYCSSWWEAHDMFCAASGEISHPFNSWKQDNEYSIKPKRIGKITCQPLRDMYDKIMDDPQAVYFSVSGSLHLHKITTESWKPYRRMFLR